jgi:DNA-binding CsgD family transcriptional regulator
MRSFALYFLERQLEDRNLISESTVQDQLDTKSLKRFLKKTSSKHKSHFASKYPDVQTNDIVDAMEEAAKETRKQKPDSEQSAKKIFKKKTNEILSGSKRRKKKMKKELSCVKALKMPSDKPIAHLTKRAEGMLTDQERKVLALCSTGKSVREIGQDIGKSFPTAWRILNSAIDKVRISHGMGSRHKDIRKKN